MTALLAAGKVALAGPAGAGRLPDGSCRSWSAWSGPERKRQDQPSSRAGAHRPAVRRASGSTAGGPRILAPPERRRLLSYLPASRDVAWPLAAEDVVRLAADPAESAEAMAALDLAPFARRRIDRLSTGERSRVLIARALAPRPRLLLLDEPVANLDPLWQLRLMERLRGAVRDGQGAIVAMHDLDLAARYADRLVLMEKGAIAADGEPGSILASARLEEVFGIRKVGGVWQPLSSPSPDGGRGTTRRVVEG